MASEMLDPSSPQAAPADAPTAAEAIPNPPPRGGVWQWLVDFAEARCERSRLVREHHSWPLQAALLTFEFFSSLSLAVILILSAAFTQAAATFVEAAYGTPAAQFGIYQSWWYMGLLGMLAVNIFCAAAIRYPWKRYQTGFVITHIGLLTLLGGTAISRWYGIDAQTQIFEGRTGEVAQEDSMQLRIWVERDRPSVESAHGMPQLKRDLLAVVPFEPGPFNWSDYGEQFALLQPDEAKQSFWQRQYTLPSRLCRYVSGGLFANACPNPVLYNRGGIRVEVLEYYSDSRLVPIPSVAVKLSMPTKKVYDEDGRLVAGATEWTEPIRLGVRPPAAQFASFPNGIGEAMPMGGGSLLFWMCGTAEQTASFRDGAPKGPIGKQGTIVLHAGGKRFEFTAEEKLNRGPFPLEGTELSALLVGASADGMSPAQNPYVVVSIIAPGGETGRLVLHADTPHLNVHDYAHGVYGNYWYDHGEISTQELMAGKGTSRFDIVQGDDLKLYYRYWNRKQVASSGELPAAGKPESAVDAFQMPIGTLKLYVDDHRASRTLDGDAEPIPFQLGKMFGRKRPATRMRLTVDGKSEEFWLAAHFGIDPEKLPGIIYERRVVGGEGRKVWLSMPLKSESIGFRIRLVEFERKLDPGTSQASHFSSTVDFLDLKRDRLLRGLDLASSRMLDFDLPQLTNPTCLAASPKRDVLYAFDAKAGGIVRIDLSEKTTSVVAPTELLGPNANPAQLTVDAAHEYLYWCDATAGAIGRVKLATRETTPRVVSGIRPIALALNNRTQQLYWLDSRAQAIGRAKFDGSEFKPKVITGIERPVGLALDEGRDVLYWSDGIDGGIRSANADGTNRQVVVSAGDLKQGAGELAFDAKSSRLYWFDAFDGTLRAKQLGPNAETASANAPQVLAAGRDGAKSLSFDPLGERLLWVEEAVLKRDVWITMNAPVEFSNPQNGRSYRLFQEQFAGPFKPGEMDFEQNVSPDSPQDDLYLSILTVNHDPGRGIWQIGCLLIIVGITVMFYMRAYFFMPGFRSEEHEEPAAA